MRNYDRETCKKKLIQKRCKIVNGTIHIPERVHLGIKMWGMIDFLKMGWTREEKRTNLKTTFNKLLKGGKK